MAKEDEGQTNALVIDSLKLENQLCFPLYAAAREVVKKYTPLLREFNLTYTQYITMMVLWDKRQIGVKELGMTLFLDSGTLTPLLKRLERQGLILRIRNSNDERNVTISITEAGMALREKALKIPKYIAECLTLSAEDAQSLYTLLYKILSQSESDDDSQSYHFLKETYV
ncbi:MAG: MarR family transcriptional regulator [Treponema sp.]|jgi:DNA-binding MarR family transcriptional regulator|nr:MarR family transcriptional regulator [Treponema sp.]